MKNSKGDNETVNNKKDVKKYPTLNLRNERDIAMDFAQKAYMKFDKMIKSIVLFGSSAKATNVPGSDIDIIIIIDDAAIRFDEKLITWWEDLVRGDPTVINIIRYGDVLIDFGGFFNPLKILLQEGRIKPTPEAIYTALQRAPDHFRRSKIAELNTIEGLFWAMVDSAQAALMSNHIMPPSPEHI